MATIGFAQTALGNGLQEFLMADAIIPGEQPSYNLCKIILTTHPLGQKMAESPIKMAQNQPREISVPAGPEDRLKEQYVRQWESDGADRLIANTMKLSRTYGIASVALLAEGIGSEVPLGSPQFPLEKLWETDIAFNVLDPLNTSGSLVLNQNPGSMDFQKVCNVSINGKVYHKSRACIILNEEPVYIDFTSSAFGFVGRSVYQRALFPLKSFINTLITDDMVVRKVGVLIAKQKSPSSIIDNVMMKIAGIKRAILKEAQTDNVISIDITEAIESLNLQNLDAPYTLARRNIIENIATAADMPAKILLQETFADGFGEGSEDAKYVAAYIDGIRKQMQPLYAFFDRIVQRRAWNPEFYKLIQKEFPDEYGRMPYNTAFYRWSNSFTASWPSLLTEPPSEKIKVDDVKLRAIIALLETLLPTFKESPENQRILIQWAAENFSELKLLFQSPLNLDLDDLMDSLEEAKEQNQKALEAGVKSSEDGTPKPPRPFADSVRGIEYRESVKALTDLTERRRERGSAQNGH
jgi:hypothetical protein